MPTPYRDKKSGIFKVRVDVPPDLVAVVGKKELRRSLGVREAREVTAAYARLMLEIEAEWEAARNGPITLTHRQRLALAGEHYERWLARHGDDPPSVRLDLVEALLERSLEGGSPIRFTVDSLASDLKAKGVPNVTHETVAKANDEAIRATAQAVRQIARHADGDYRPDPDASRFPQWKDNGAKAAFTFTEAVDLWAHMRKPAAKTAKDYRRKWTLMGEFLGHADVAKLSIDDVRRWRDHLNEQGHDPVYIRESYLAALHAILNVAVSEGRLTANPAQGVKVYGKSKKADKRPFTDEEARTILRATFDTPPKNLTPTHKAARRWVPWLCAYTGTRVGEMTQLRKQDVREIDGVHCVVVTPNAGSQKGGKEWAIPLHPHLLEQGFLDFVDKAKAGPLFTNPASKRALTGEEKHLHKSRAEKLGAWVRSLGITDPDLQPNHGWRHTFKTKARGMKPKMDAEIRDYIQCHAPRTEGDGYGRYPITAIKEELDRFPSFVL